MTLLAARESYARPQYTYGATMLAHAIMSFLIGLLVVDAIAFSVIVRPTPWFEAQYLIPVSGMLLGNAINGVSIGMDQLLSQLAERRIEVELLLAFGATKHEASRPVLRDAIRIALTPTLNSMTVIGMISIPGMMTGQILGGTPPVQAARYQIMIMFLILANAFTATSISTRLGIRTLFDKGDRLRIKRLTKRTKSLRGCGGLWRSCWSCCKNYCCRHNEADDYIDINELTKLTVPKKTRMIEEWSTSSSSTPRGAAVLHASCISRTMNGNMMYRDVSLNLYPGEVIPICGPSGCGKTLLLRSLALLDPIEGDGKINLYGEAAHPDKSTSSWRRRVLFVGQGKLTLTTSPMELCESIAKLSAQKSSGIRIEQMKTAVIQQTMEWGLPSEALHRSWVELSGGECQLCVLSIALASKPEILLLDEPTGACDPQTKVLVERKLLNLSPAIPMLWVTHDQEQAKRIARPRRCIFVPTE